MTDDDDDDETDFWHWYWFQMLKNSKVEKFKSWKIQKFLPMQVMEKNNNAEKAKGYDWNTG